MIAGLLTRVMFYSEIFGGGGRGNNNSGGQLVLIEMVVMLVSIVVYFVSFLLTMALSRYRELAADRSGAILIGQPSVLAAALIKISGEMGRVPTKDLRAAEPFNAFFFMPAVSNARTKGGAKRRQLQFRQPLPHPPSLERRLAQLDQLQHELDEHTDPLRLTWASSIPCWAGPSRSRPTSTPSLRCPRRP